MSTKHKQLTFLFYYRCDNGVYCVMSVVKDARKLLSTIYKVYICTHVFYKHETYTGVVTGTVTHKLCLQC